jgi:hypothetical protein
MTDEKNDFREGASRACGLLESCSRANRDLLEILVIFSCSLGEKESLLPTNSL